MSNTPDLEDALARLNRTLERQGLSYVVIGGFAVIVLGYDRMTRDIDAVVMGADPQLDDLVAALAEEGLTIRAGDMQFVKQFRILRLISPGGTDVDLSLGFLPFEDEAVRRAQMTELTDELTIPIATAEDIIIMKLIASRDRDIDDCFRLLELYPQVNETRIHKWVKAYAELSEIGEVILQNLDRVMGKINRGR